MAAREKLEGQIFGDFKLVAYIGDKQYRCKCINCNDEIKDLRAANIKNGIGVTCKLKKAPPVDLTGQTIGEWKVLEYLGNRRYRCMCSCSTPENPVIRDVLKVNLMNGSSTSCGHKRIKYSAKGIKPGDKIGEWTFLEKVEYQWKVQCSCGKVAIRGASDIIKGRSKSCGHGYNEFEDISGQEFGLWKVLKYIGNQYYLCECQCDNKTQKEVRKADLLRGASTSCGCNRREKAKDTLLMRYGEIAPTLAGKNNRTPEQVNALLSKENLLAFIVNVQTKYNSKITSGILSEHLSVGLNQTLKWLHAYELEDSVLINSGKSTGEIELYEYIRSVYSGIIIQSDRNTLAGKEIDIHLPEIKLAFEYNGTYWHSSILKHYKFHQDKVLHCKEKGIRLIHVYEYEWVDTVQREKIKKFIHNLISDNIKRLYAREFQVLEINSDIANIFLDRYHLQGKVNSPINLALCKDNKIYCVMSFGKPRFNNDCEYELLRLCYYPDVRIIGGAEKLFKYFVDNWNPQSIISYSNIDKFTGEVYNKLKFNFVEITSPNYIWVEANTHNVLTRYQTQKHKLIDQGLGIEEQTEDEIMTSLGYYKIYDSGNLKFIWNRDIA